MIWFACKQCGKRHGRADNLVGTLVFCECGHGNRVPWSSTAAEPEPSELPPEPPPPPPAPPRARRAEPLEDDDDAPPPAAPLRRRPREVRRPNPAYCLNHDEAASERTCDDCRCSFCAACVVTLQGKTLCGPCKNFRVRGLNRPARFSAMAIVAFVVAAVGGPVAFFLTLMAVGMQAQTGNVGGAVGVCVLALALPAASLVLGWLALRDIETKPNVAGRSLAASGAVASLTGFLYTLTLAILMVAKQFSG
jgi:hypothetical protein